MSRKYKPWILTKTCGFTPDGSLQLGQILAVPADPAYVLQPNGPLKFLDGMNVEHGVLGGLSLQTIDELSAHFHGWARSSVIAAGHNAGSTKDRSNHSVWHFERLETYTISPSLAYVKQAMRHGDVEASLKRWRWKERVYMVTGVQIARGARLRRSNEDSTSFEADMQTSAPEEIVTLGVKAAMGQKMLDSQRFDQASDFVFAYRLNEISYSGKISHRPYRGGEMASADAPYVRHEPRVVVNR